METDGDFWSSFSHERFSDIHKSHLGVQWSTDCSDNNPSEDSLGSQGGELSGLTFSCNEESVHILLLRPVDTPLGEYPTYALTLSVGVHAKHVQICS
jgi:hypothetical protein